MQTAIFNMYITYNKSCKFMRSIKTNSVCYNFVVTFAAAAIFSYWWLVPMMLYGALWWRRSQASFTFLEILCLYGYSLAIYIPISVSVYREVQVWTIFNKEAYLTSIRPSIYFDCEMTLKSIPGTNQY